MWSSNFSFLKDKWPILANLGEMAEKNIYKDPNTSLYKLRLFGEMMAKFILAYENMAEPEDNRQVTRIKMLKSEDLLPKEIDDIFYVLRIKGNDATHEATGSVEDAATSVSLAYKLGVWFMQTYGKWDFEPTEFIMPSDIDDSEELKKQLSRLTENYEEEIKKLQKQLEGLRCNQFSSEEKKARKNQSFRVANRLYLNEKETRKIIDKQLQLAGWEADTENLKYSKGTRPEKNRNLAIAEWPTKNGFADYALFAGLTLVGIVEAKKKGKDVISDLEQAKQYSKDIEILGEEVLPGGPWDEYKVPFLFATNGRPYLKQLETKSGIWFLDARKKTNHPRALQAWYTPEGLLDMVKHDIDEANNKLKSEPFDYLVDSLRLRDYQISAIKSIEKALEDGKRSILIAMATGTGKTRTIIGLVYRLLKTKRFKRILFLVDRTSLGEQVEDAFKEARIEDLLNFTEIYDLKGLNHKVPESHTKIHISTVQGMVKRIMYSENPEDIPAIDWYDCIIVDEAHRGYILDKEMGDTELEFRDQNDYVSKYRKVLEYFDAVKIGLTATPAIHTVEIFGKPVFTYSYREAVIDGYLVDHEPPYQIVTKLKTEGIKWKKGEVVPIYDPVTGEILNSDELPDDLNFDVEKFNKLVITENFNRTVIKELIKYLDPDGQEKTLIFASTDDHADMIVKILKEEFENRGISIDDNAIVKITGSIKDPLGTIRKFKNERLPNIVITVDLLTTGIDVPEICNLVFLRTVKSRILYEQMLGRATRLCPLIGKTHFNIFDAVGVYETLEKVTNMKPVVARPNVTLTTLVNELHQINEEEKQKQYIDQIITKIQRKYQRFKKEDSEQFKAYTGYKSPKEFIEKIKKLPIDEAVKEIKKRTKVFDFLDESIYRPKKQFISYHEDKLRKITRGYGNAERPEDYLDAFGNFIIENMNKIPALQIVCQRPKKLTRKALRELKLELDKHGYSETRLNAAWKQISNEDIVADIISFIRQRALGDPIESHEERIKRAVKKVKQLNNWTTIQKKWLDRIEKQLIRETVVDRESFDHEPFKSHGGYDRINKVFEGKLDQVLNKINESLYPERGTA
ncbi:type I restriction-modification system endonuclease [Caminicella sporogenes]|uniref:type I restriction-modification system endonuclease n=1 Tax=Caminicella sporogenes TaxID=166485 RepID=UPI00253F7288|nr:type I restriction-modification system endonuclease [Caminicella sporogenes]WIF95099.1 type I restriction-modification system endonuclease [Caminicella sporogenes]